MCAAPSSTHRASHIARRTSHFEGLCSSLREPASTDDLCYFSKMPKNRVYSAGGVFSPLPLHPPPLEGVPASTVPGNKENTSKLALLRRPWSSHQSVPSPMQLLLQLLASDAQYLKRNFLVHLIQIKTSIGTHGGMRVKAVTKRTDCRDSNLEILLVITGIFVMALNSE
jgi:hypothetical protein